MTLRQPAKGYRAAIDPILLAAFVQAKAGQHVIELGCGTGAALLALNARVPGLMLAAIEPDAEMRALAINNVALNDGAAEIMYGAVGGDWTLPDNAFDHVLFNPPFYDAAAYSEGPAATRTQAHSLKQPLAMWVSAAKRALKGNGSLTAVIHAQQLVELCAALHGWGAIEILPVQPRVGEAASRVLVRARLGRRTAPVLRAPFILHERHGYTAAANAVLLDAEAIL